ncbi:MAG: S8 family serine peptidase [Bradymonadales bacterium]|nr:S8 family serine peptidase [Bradymonadales bacterium]
MPLLDILTIGLSVAGMWELGRCRVARLRYGQHRKGRVGWLLIMVAIAVRLALGPHRWPLDLVITARDLGFGLIAASYQLLVKRSNPRPWFIWGVLLVALWAGYRFGPGRDGRIELLVELGPDDHVGEIQRILEDHDARWEQAFPSISLEQDEDLAQYYLVACPARRAEALREALRLDRENVDSVQINERVSLVPPIRGSMTPTLHGWDVTDDPRGADQWGLQQSGGIEALRLLKNARPVRAATVAILDTGVDSGHVELGRVFLPSPGGEDGHGHGTHCAGIAGAIANNGLGIASLNLDGRFLQIASYPALTRHGHGTIESIAQAIIDATQGGVDVISLSLGGYHPEPPKAQVDAIEFALRSGVIVVAAAGNNGEDARHHAPANIPGVIAVAAVDREGRRAPFSNGNTSLQRPIAAPGVDILSLAPGGDYVSYSGTSMATPMVAGLLGLMRSLDPNLTAEQAYRILADTGDRGADADRVGRTINMGNAIRRLLR